MSDKDKYNNNEYNVENMSDNDISKRTIEKTDTKLINQDES